jgi:hypothetical protein
MAKAEQSWQEEINKEHLFLIPFAIEWKQSYGKIPEDEFQKRMISALREHEERTGTVYVHPPQHAGVGPGAAGEKKQLPARRSSPARMTAHGRRPLPSVDPTTAGPSSLRPQVDPQVERDEQMARQLQNAMDTNEPRRFRDIDGSTTDSDEDEEMDSKGKGKKTKRKGKAEMTDSDDIGKETDGKAKGKGKVPVARQRAGIAKEGRPVPTGSGEFFDSPCSRCEGASMPCEKDVKGGACVRCKTKKVGCEHAPPKSHPKPRQRKETSPSSSDSEYADGKKSRKRKGRRTRRLPKSRPAVTDSDKDVPSHAGPSKREQRSKPASPKKARRKQRDNSKPANKKKSAGTRRGIGREVQEVMDVLNSELNFMSF